MQLEAVRKQSFIEYDGFLAKGYNDSAFWLRLKVDPKKHLSKKSDLNDYLVMVIRPANLDEIQVYDPLDSENVPYLLGDTIEVDRNYKNQNQSLNINKIIARGDAPRDIWLRLKTSGANLIDVRAYIQSDVYRFEKKREFLYEFNIAYCLFFLIWCLYCLTFSKKTVIVAFAIKQVFGLTLTILLYGYFRFLFSDDFSAAFIDKLSSSNVILYGTASVYFDYALLKELQSKKQGSKILLLLILCCPFELLLLYSGFAMYALQLNMIITAISPFFSFFIAVFYKGDILKSQDRSLVLSYNILLFSYFLISILSILFLLSIFGFLPFDERVLNGRVMQGFIAGILLITVLRIHSNQIEKNRQLAIKKIELKQQELDIEWQHQEEKSQFLGILAHDLKTPLALIKMVLGIKDFSVDHINYLNNAVNDMNSVIERCLQVSELEERKLSLIFTEINLLNVLNELKKQSPAHRRINVNCDKSLTLQTDDQILQIILSNLIDNANKYSASHTGIFINVSRCFHNNCNGIEIAIDNIPGSVGWPDPDKVFQKYYRANNQQLSGSGQGLYLIKKLAVILKGYIRYMPYETHVSFVLWLPNNPVESEKLSLPINS
ncbi:MAG: 7TM-DISM domain-containing protein [Methylomonas sp.]